MISIACYGDIFKADVEALVNPVNTVGTMGKGLALQFKDKYPDNYKEYKRACLCGELVRGQMFVFKTQAENNPKYIINFPTKGHWRNKSSLITIRAGLLDLRHIIQRENIRTIAIPALGCGNGGLNWAEVKPVIQKILAGVETLRVFLYEPN